MSEYEVITIDDPIELYDWPNYAVVCDGVTVAYCENEDMAHMIAEALNVLRQLRQPASE